MRTGKPLGHATTAVVLLAMITWTGAVPDASGAVAGTQNWSMAGQGTSGRFVVSGADGTFSGQMDLANGGKFTVGAAECTFPSPFPFKGTISGTNITFSGTAANPSGTMTFSGNGTTDTAFPNATSAKGGVTVTFACGGTSQSVPAGFTAKRVN